MNFFISKNSTAKLLEWKQGDETEKWVKKAVSYLVKKLKSQKGALSELENVLTSRSADSPCITIPKTADGRLQIKYYKTFPHVIYCRVWRWPDLRSPRELAAVKNCKYPCGQNHAEVCVNPYHYQRIIYRQLSPVLVPRNLNHSQEHGSVFVDDADNISTPQNVPLEKFTYNNCNEVDLIVNEYLSEPAPSSYRTLQKIVRSPDASSSIYKSNSTVTDVNYTPSISSQSNQNHQNVGQSSDGFSFQQQSVGHSSDGFPSLPQNIDQSSVRFSSSTQSDGQSSSGLSSPAHNVGSSLLRKSSVPQNVVVSQCNQYENEAFPVAYQEPVIWATIAYYELNLRVGEVYQCRAQSVYVDGYTHPTKDSDRFCLGRLSSTNRNSTIENTRKHIGNGVHFYYVGGEVHAECLSDCAIFIQSRSCNYSHGFDLTTVCKIPPKCSLKIFNNYDFAKLLSQTVPQGFAAVFELTKMCTIRLSFVKGWGTEYHRNDVTATPCWIEVHLHGPLQWLDNVLKQMETPYGRISSVS